ncbi:hypothetical protein C7S13_1365 [Burkholderia cepacia]|nr:hypothetical protein [Burkholderia cepacia]
MFVKSIVRSIVIEITIITDYVGANSSRLLVKTSITSRVLDLTSRR